MITITGRLELIEQEGGYADDSIEIDGRILANLLREMDGLNVTITVDAKEGKS